MIAETQVIEHQSKSHRRDGAGAVSPVAFGLVLDYLRFGDHAASAWGLAFMVFAIGGFGATWYAWRFRRP